MPIRTRALLPALGLALGLLTACGGGGGGGATSPTSPTYTGRNAPAVITSMDQVDRLTAGALMGAQTGGMVIGAQVEGTARAAAGLPGLVQALETAAALVRPEVVLAASSISRTVSDPCGTGQATFTGSSDTVNGVTTATGVLSANNYCCLTQYGTYMYLTGVLRFSIVGTSDYDYQVSLDTTYMRVAQGNMSLAYRLSYQRTYVAGVGGAATLNAVFRAQDGTTYQLLDYQVRTDLSTYTMWISGRFFDPLLGYVDVSTPASGVAMGYCQALGYYVPLSGWIQVTGAGGGYGVFAPQDCYTYQLCYNLNDGAGDHCASYSWQ